MDALGERDIVRPLATIGIRTKGTAGRGGALGWLGERSLDRVVNMQLMLGWGTGGTRVGTARGMEMARDSVFRGSGGGAKQRRRAE